MPKLSLDLFQALKSYKSHDLNILLEQIRIENPEVINYLGALCGHYDLPPYSRERQAVGNAVAVLYFAIKAGLETNELEEIIG